MESLCVEHNAKDCKAAFLAQVSLACNPTTSLVTIQLRHNTWQIGLHRALWMWMYKLSHAELYHMFSRQHQARLSGLNRYLATVLIV